MNPHDLFDGFENPSHMEGFKTCTKCHITKPKLDFHYGTGAKGGMTHRHGHCKLCHSGMTEGGAKAKKNIQPPDKLTHKCDACGRGHDEVTPKGKWCADHDHATGAFRGWVCQGCNMSMGNLKDNYEYFIRVAEYLLEFKIKQKEPPSGFG